MSNEQPLRETAEHLAAVIKVGRIVRMLEPPGTERNRRQVRMAEFLIAKFYRQAGREGMTDHQANALLARSDDDVALAREQIQCRN